MEYPCKDCPTGQVIYACEQSTCSKHIAYKQFKAVSESYGANTDEYERLARIAHDIVFRTMCEGEKDHPGNEGLVKDINYHIQHGYAHACNANIGNNTIENMEHCITRFTLAMDKLKVV